MDVRVCGPNLRDQSKGTFHVHADGCKDLLKYGYNSIRGGDTPGNKEMLVKNATTLAVVFAVYDNGILDEAEERGETKMEIAESYISDFWFAPCCEGHLEHGEEPGEPSFSLNTEMPNGATVHDWLGTCLVAVTNATHHIERVNQGTSVNVEAGLDRAHELLTQALEELSIIQAQTYKKRTLQSDLLGDR